MKRIRKTITATLFFLLCSSALWAQIPVEVLAGHKQVQYQGYFFNTLDKKQRVSFFGMSRFAMDYENELFNNSFISSQVTYNFSRSWGVSTGASFANNTLSPIVALSYTAFSKNEDFFVNLFPTAVLGNELSFELTGLAIYAPKISQNLRLFSQVIFTSQVNSAFNQHQFSNQQLRLGLGIKDWFQVGVGFDNTMLGPLGSNADALNPTGGINFQNFGIFLRKEL